MKVVIYQEKSNYHFEVKLSDFQEYYLVNRQTENFNKKIEPTMRITGSAALDILSLTAHTIPSGSPSRPAN